MWKDVYWWDITKTPRTQQSKSHFSLKYSDKTRNVSWVHQHGNSRFLPQRNKENPFFWLCRNSYCWAADLRAELLTDSIECVVVNPHYCSVLRTLLNILLPEKRSLTFGRTNSALSRVCSWWYPKDILKLLAKSQNASCGRGRRHFDVALPILPSMHFLLYLSLILKKRKIYFKIILWC